MSQSRLLNQTIRCNNPSCPAKASKLFRNQKGINHHFGKSPACSQYFEWEQRVYLTRNEPQFTYAKQPPTRLTRSSTQSLPDDSDEDDADMPPLEEFDMDDNSFGVPSLDCEPMLHPHPEEDINNKPAATMPATQVVHRPPNVYDPSKPDNSTSFRQWVRDWISWSNYSNAKKEESADTTAYLADNLWMLHHLLDDPNFGPGWSMIPKSERAEIALLDRLNKIKGCPLSLYDDVISWAREHLQSDSDIDSDQNIIPLLRNRDRCMKHFESCAHAEVARPETVTIQLEESEGKVNLTKIPFLATLYGMLTDVQLMQDRCLLMNGPSPYSDPDKKPPIFDDFNTGSRYVDAHFNLKQDDIDYPLGIINFIDASVFDRGDRLSTEMVFFTILLLNRETRNKSHAWRSLGSIPNFHRVNHKCADQKVIDYHQLLGVLLEDIKLLQQTTAGILWPLMYAGKFDMIRIKPYQLCVLSNHINFVCLVIHLDKMP